MTADLFRMVHVKSQCLRRVFSCAISASVWYSICGWRYERPLWCNNKVALLWPRIMDLKHGNSLLHGGRAAYLWPSLARIQVPMEHPMGHWDEIQSHVMGQNHPANIPASQLEHLETSSVPSVGTERDGGASHPTKKSKQPYPIGFKNLLRRLHSDKNPVC